MSGRACPTASSSPTPGKRNSRSSSEILTRIGQRHGFFNRLLGVFGRIPEREAEIRIVRDQAARVTCAPNRLQRGGAGRLPCQRHRAEVKDFRIAEERRIDVPDREIDIGGRLVAVEGKAPVAVRRERHEGECGAVVFRQHQMTAVAPGIVQRFFAEKAEAVPGRLSR